jgi:hypothetical protein
MTIWMVVGLHKRRWQENVLRNFRRQVHADKRLVIVLNGEYADIDYDGEYTNWMSLHRSGSDPAQVMNCALNHLRENADHDDWFCKCDADDYYGPLYLQHVAENTLADYSGLKSVYVKSQDNKLWFAEGNARTAIVHGPTIAARVGTALRFKEGLDWGEDTLWCQEMQAAGREHSIRPSDGFCYQRWAGYSHTWPCTDEELLAAWPIPMYELGEFDEEVVDGLKPHRYSKVLEARELTLNNSMPYRVLMERMNGKAESHVEE